MRCGRGIVVVIVWGGGRAVGIARDGSDGRRGDGGSDGCGSCRDNDRLLKRS